MIGNSHTSAVSGFKSGESADRTNIERIYQLWDEALGRKDLEAALTLYADDASIESPLVAHLLSIKEGIVQGKDDMRNFIALVFQTQPPQRKRFRTGFFTDGTRSRGSTLARRRRATRWIWWKSCKSRMD